MSTRSRRLLWTASVILAFILGYLLARRRCVRDSAGASGMGNTRVVAKGDPSQSARSHIKLGTGEGAASSTGGTSGNIDGGVDTANGGGAAGGGGGADAGNGGGSGVMPGGSGVFKKTPRESDSLFGNYVARLAEDQDNTGKRMSDSAVDQNVTVRVANDFSLDGTGLPRYPNGVTRVMSSIAVRTDVPADTATGCALETHDSFQTVAAWYHQRVPSGWHETSTANLQQTAAKLSPENIMKMLMSGDTSDTAAQADTGAAAGLEFAGWSAPYDNADSTHSARSVMVIARPGEPTQVTMSRTVRP